MEVKIAKIQDADEIKALMLLAIETLQTGYLTPQQIQASHFAVHTSRFYPPWNWAIDFENIRGCSQSCGL